jgi:hypothetical protein
MGGGGKPLSLKYLRKKGAGIHDSREVGGGGVLSLDPPPVKILSLDHPPSQ